jgi:hypothetical protein
MTVANVRRFGREKRTHDEGPPAKARSGEDSIPVVLAQITGGDLTPARQGETAGDTLRARRELSPVMEGGGHDG